jgi:CUG-BP- and ETR3-like factor
MSSVGEAEMAMEELDNKYTWEGMVSRMVVKLMDAALQRRRREQHVAAMRHGALPSLALSGTVKPPGSDLSLDPHFVSQDLTITESPPAGCSPDTIKLFVGNIPRGLSEEELLPLFETAGEVIECVVVRDRASAESKGSAFVWYSTREMAERAIQQFHLRHVLPDPTGAQDRPLIVRKAKARTRPNPLLLAENLVPGVEEVPGRVASGLAQVRVKW